LLKYSMSFDGMGVGSVGGELKVVGGKFSMNLFTPPDLPRRTAGHNRISGNPRRVLSPQGSIQPVVRG
jgi:hypothetical protein